MSARARSVHKHITLDSDDDSCKAIVTHKSSGRSKKTLASAAADDSDDTTISVERLAIVKAPSREMIVSKRRGGGKKKALSADKHASMQDIMPYFENIWSKLTNSCKKNYRTFDADDEKWDFTKFRNYVDLLYFVMRHGFHFKEIVNKYNSIVCSTLAEKETMLGWETKLFVMVQNPSTGGSIIIQMGADDSAYKEYVIASDVNLLCADILRNEKIQYQMTVCHNKKKVITIQFPSIRERDFWKKCMLTDEDEDAW